MIKEFVRKLLLAAFVLLAFALMGLQAWGWLHRHPKEEHCWSPVEGSPPAKIQGLTDVTAIGHFYGLLLAAVRKDGSVWTWDRGSSCVPKPNRFHPDAHAQSAVAIASGESHQLVLQPDGHVWGFQLSGYAYHHTLGSDARDVREIPGLHDITQIAAGGYHSLALQAGGQVYGWGANDCGQLGEVDGESPKGDARVHAIGPLSDVAQIAAGYRHSLALKRDGTVWQMGNLSNAWFQSHSTPPVPGWFYCGETYDAWQGHQPDTAEHPKPQQIEGLDHVVAIASQYTHNLALRSDGTVWGWGANDCAQTGSELDQDPAMGALIYRPVRVPDLDHVIAIATGKAHSLALRSDGTVWAWGQNYLSQLGSNPKQYKQDMACLAPRTVPFHAIHTSIPVKVPHLPRIVAITAGNYFSAALDENGEVWIWGSQDMR
jgi:alpha-tubulin suppressor-like RCC1 family protein